MSITTTQDIINILLTLKNKKNSPYLDDKNEWKKRAERLKKFQIEAIQKAVDLFFEEDYFPSVSRFEEVCKRENGFLNPTHYTEILCKCERVSVFLTEVPAEFNCPKCKELLVFESLIKDGYGYYHPEHYLIGKN